MAAAKKKTSTTPAKKTRAGKAPSEATLRRAIIATAQAMSTEGLSPGRSGNVSARHQSGMLITPSGRAYDTMKPADIVFVADDGTVKANSLKPSSEWRFHLAAYKARSDAQAVVHTHSRFATALACAHKPIPAFHYMVAVAGGDDIPLVPYAPFGTEVLADHVADGLSTRRACLMANHGQIATGATLSAALELAREVETLGAQYTSVLSIGKPKLLTSGQMADVLDRFAAYYRDAG